MSRILEKYLDHVMVYADRDERDSAEIRAELKDHLLKKTADLESEGLSHEDAVFEAIEDHGRPKTVGYGLRKRRWIDVRTQGTARGFVAIGPRAVGTFAIGGLAVGVFSFGIAAIGVVSFSVVGIALLYCYGMTLAIAPAGLATGTAAVGLMAAGHWPCGLVAVGPHALGPYVQYPHASHMPGQAPYAIAYAYALMHEYLMLWGGRAAPHALHKLIFGIVMAVGSALCWRAFRSDQRRIGYTLLRF
ncbi:MAG: hypothetical protein JSU94_19745 [Phycisphaerales bacterium]|nr:MAG: hypothetical protein JSU94_19745 [Phycisphaerales bacterium]